MIWGGVFASFAMAGGEDTAELPMPRSTSGWSGLYRIDRIETHDGRLDNFPVVFQKEV
jgi:hypothetical protein